MKIFNIGIFPKRYFMIDFTRARLTIYKNRRDNDSAQIVLFRDVLKCFGLNWQGSKPTAYWTYSFYLETTARKYVLVAATPQEKEIWLAAFKYIIPSTKTLQDIIKGNDDTQKKEPIKQPKGRKLDTLTRSASESVTVKNKAPQAMNSHINTKAQIQPTKH